MIKQKRAGKQIKFFSMIIGIATIIVGCNQGQAPTLKPVNIDGSSTVYPISQEIAKQFNREKLTSVPINIEFSGTSGGFKKFCSGQTEINNASRPIKTTEMEACKQAGIAYIELPIAFDALTVVVNPKNNLVSDITVEELKQIWQPISEGKITKWNQIRPNWPDQPLKLYAPGKDSGTFDYFTEAIVGKSGASRSDYTASEDDTILEQYLSQDANALGYFGFAYYEANKNDLKALAIKGNKSAVLPSRQAVEKAEYQPLARPLFIYVNASAAQKNPALEAFVRYYLQQAPKVSSMVGYIPLPTEGYRLVNIHWERGKVGTVFGGKSEFNLTIDELLRKQAEF